MTQVKEVMLDERSNALSRRDKRLKADEEKLEALIKKAQEERGSEQEPTEEPEGETGSDAGEKETADEKPVKVEEDENLTAEERSFKKRYGDLRKHSQKQIDELKKELENLKSGKKDEMPADPKLVEKWVKDHPQVASIVKKLAEDIAEQKLSGATERFQRLEQEEEKIRLSRMESEVKKAHKDFDDLKNNDKFHSWLEDQPKVLQDLVYENADDAKSLIRVLDLFKSETKKKGPMSAVDSRGRSHPNENFGDKKVWKTSEISKLSSKEFAKYADEIEEANREGRVIRG